MAELTVLAPAKVNLALDVLHKRSDGYHEIRSLMMAVGLYDRLRLADGPPGRVDLVCAAGDVPTDASNLVHRAASRLIERQGGRYGCRIVLEKRIPVGGGMGGGSSDAAAALSGLNRLWGAGLSNGDLAEIGASIGSDVPFFLALPCAVVSGRGEHVVPVGLRWRGWVALVAAGVPVPTVEVYRRWRSPAERPARCPVEHLVEIESAEEMNRLLRNDLEEAVFAVAPAVKRMRDALRELGAECVRVSGAGSVGFALFDNEAGARELVDRVRAGGLAAAATVVEAPARTG